jgi:hypothetical protein
MRTRAATVVVAGMLVLVMPTHVGAARTTTTVGDSQPTADDLATAAIDGSYRVSALITSEENTVGDNVGQTTVLGIPMVLRDGGAMSFYFPNFSYTRDGASLTMTGSNTTDCLGADGTTTTPNGYDSASTLQFEITEAVLVDGTWQATQLEGTGDFTSTARPGNTCEPAFQKFDLTGFRLDPPIAKVSPAAAAPPGGVAGTAQAATADALIDGGAVASVRLAIDPAKADPFATRSADATVVVTGSWFTFDTAPPIPGMTLVPTGGTGPSLVCGTSGPVDITLPTIGKFGVVFADTGRYADASEVPAAIGDVNQLLAIPYDPGGTIFNNVVTQTSPPQVTASLAGCTSTITYRFAGTFFLSTTARAGTYLVLPVGITIPFLTAQGATVTLPFTDSDLPTIEVAAEPITTVPPSTVAATTPPTTAAAVLDIDEGGGDSSTTLVAGGAVALVGLAGGGTWLARSRRPSKRGRSSRDQHRTVRSDHPQVRPSTDTGTQKVTSAGGGHVFGVRVVSSEPGTTTIRMTGAQGDHN